MSAKDFVTKQIIPGKMVTKYRCVRRCDVTDQDNPSEVSIWERGQVLYWLAREKTELTIMRNGAQLAKDHLQYERKIHQLLLNLIFYTFFPYVLESYKSKYFVLAAAALYSPDNYEDESHFVIFVIKFI